MAGGGQQSSSQTQSGPPSYLQPYVTYGASQDQALYNTGGPQYYPGTTVAAQSPYTTAANQGIASLATGGNPTTSAAQGYAQGVLGGQYLNPGNPYLSQVTKSLSDQITPQIQSQMTLAGRGGSVSEDSEITRQMSDALAPYLFNNYQNERGIQQQTAGMAPSLDQAQYYGLDQLAGVGQGQDAYGQQLVNAPMQQWNYNQNLPFNNLQNYMAMLGLGAYQGNSTTTTSQPSGGFGGFLGGLLGGL